MKLQTLIDTEKLLVMPDNEYHAASGLDFPPSQRPGKFLSSHLLITFQKNPAKFLRLATGQEKFPDCHAFRFGSAAHSLILEGIANVDHFSYEDVEMLSAMQKAVRSHPVAAAVLATGRAELVARAALRYHDCQVRLDWLTEYGMDCLPILVDLKTTKSLRVFADDTIAYGYIDQMAFYEMVLRNVLDAKYDDLKVLLIAVEKVFSRKDHRPRCAVYSIRPEWMAWGQRRQLITLDATRFCCERGVFGETFPIEFAAQMPDPPKCPPLIEIKKL